MRSSDQQLLSWYKIGFERHLWGRKQIRSENALENVAYDLGALHAEVGDDVRSVDYLSDKEILALIRHKQEV